MSYFKRYTNKVWPTCVKLDGSAETAALGYSPVSGAQTNTAMATKNVGAGIGIVWNDDNDAQSTCDESQNGTPSRPEDESTGVYKIVKSYRIRNLDTNVLTDKGTYVKPDSSPKISIEDESEYKLIAWKTSTTYKSDIVSIKWESTVPAVHKQSGTTPTTIEMKAPETTLYLSGWENVTTTGLKEPLAKQAALMYNLLRKVDRTRSSDLPSVKLILQKK